MATRLELTRYARTSQDLEAPASPQIGTHKGRCYQLMSKRRESVSHCFTATKDYASHLYGPPYPPLTTNQVKTNYLEAGLCVICFGVVEGLSAYMIISEATNPSLESQISRGITLGACSFAEGIFLGASALFLRIIHKTYHAPRQEEAPPR